MSGVDTALVDITAKAYGVPVRDCWVGAIEVRSLYASLLFDMDDVQGTAEKGARYIRENYFGVKFGWGIIPSKPFGADADADENMVKTIRETFGPRGNIMVDVGRYVNWTSDYAIRIAKRLENTTFSGLRRRCLRMILRDMSVSPIPPTSRSLSERDCTPSMISRT